MSHAPMSGRTPEEIVAPQTAGVMRKVAKETAGRDRSWGYVKVSELGEGDFESKELRARKLFEAKAGAPVRFGPSNDLAAVWLLDGEPSTEPNLPAPIVASKPEWANVTKAILDRRMPLGTKASKADYMRLALEHFGLPGDDTNYPVRFKGKLVEVWLHRGEPIQ